MRIAAELVADHIAAVLGEADDCKLAAVHAAVAELVAVVALAGFPAFRPK